MRVVIVGAGKIGCGMLAPLFVDAGWHVTLGVRTAERAAQIAGVGGWDVRTTGTGRTRSVTGVDAVAMDEPGMDRAVAAADLLVTAVGVGNVAALGPPLARALAARPIDRPLDVWVVENDDCATALRRSLEHAARGSGGTLPPLGVAGAVATVAVGRGSWSGEGRPTFVGDAYRSLAVDGTALLTPLPALPEVRATPHYSADLRAKLYVFNAGHAIVAYLGWLRRHRTIDAAIADPLLRPIVVGCLLESRKALLAVHPELGDDAHGPVAEALERYAEPELADPISRVARDPKRKLSPGDRLLGPAALIREATGQVPAHLALGVAGALLYRDPQDRQAEELRGALSSRGLRAVLSDVCGIGGDDHMGHAVEVRYRGFIFTPSEILFPPVHTTDALLAPRFPEPVGPAGDADDVGDIDRDAPVVRS